jgi:hypothetical protein
MFEFVHSTTKRSSNNQAFVPLRSRNESGLAYSFMHHHGRMVHGHDDIFFPLGSYSLANLHIGKGLKVFQGFQNWGSFYRMASKWDNGGGVFQCWLGIC